MAFRDFPKTRPAVQLLQRSLERGRLAHAYLFTGHQPDDLEELARALAKALNCQGEQKTGQAEVRRDCCDHCLPCQKIEHGNHPDVHWVRPESKTRVITIEQMRVLMQDINLKPTEAEYKVFIVVAADRMNEKAANAFLKTLEEPPARSILILLSTEPQRVLETILSRCLRLNFAVEGPQQLVPAQEEWLKSFSEMAGAEQKSLLGRYRLMDVLLRKLNESKTGIEENLRTRSPLNQYKDAEKDLVEKWEDELTAAVEAEYRRQRTDLLVALQWWLRDVWVECLKSEIRNSSPGNAAKGRSPKVEGQVEIEEAEPQELLLNFPHLPATRKVSSRISAAEALKNLQVMEQLQRWLGTNVQEALALEVGLLKLTL
jgi:DNA polymerase III subunit delta'